MLIDSLLVLFVQKYSFLNWNTFSNLLEVPTFV